MRDLTPQEIKNAPEWATLYNIGSDNEIFWIGEEFAMLQGGEKAHRRDICGYFSCIKIIPRKAFDISEYESENISDIYVETWNNNSLGFEVSASLDDTAIGIDKNDAIAFAKHFKLTADELK